MASININQKLFSIMSQINTKLERIEVDVREIKDEIGLEVRPEYIEKLNNIQRQKGRAFDNKQEFLNYTHGQK